MAEIPEQKIAEVRDRIDILAVIGRTVSLKKTGRSWKGLCPFHQEKTPSFIVDPERGLYHCFGCKAGGDAIRFLMDFEGRTFLEAIQVLAAEVGVQLPEADAADDPVAVAAGKKRKLLKKVNEKAADFYSRCLHREKEGEPGRKYLQLRGIKDKEAKRFGLGYAPLSGRMRYYIQKAGFSGADLEGAGLLVQGRKGLYERFRGRIMIPIRDQEGNTVAFGGRLVEGDAVKYINSPETPIYRKSDILYGFKEARTHIRRKNTVIVVEGYFDLIALVQAGIENVTATCGTALTKEHCRILSRHAGDIILVFDGDTAGNEAVERAYEVVSDIPGIIVRVASLPPGDDPDSFVRNNGVDAFRKLCEEALPLAEVLIGRKLTGVGMAVEDRIRAVKKIKPYLLRIRDPFTTRVYIRQIAEKLDIDEMTISEHILKKDYVEKNKISSEPESVKNGLKTDEFPPDEEALCLLFMEYPQLLDNEMVEEILESLCDERSRETLCWMLYQWREKNKIDACSILESITDESIRFRWREHLAELASISGCDDQSGDIDACRKMELLFKRIIRRADIRRQKSISEEISGIEDPVERARRIQEARKHCLRKQGKV